MKILPRTSAFLMATAAASVIAASAGLADTAAYNKLDDTLRHELTQVGIANADVSKLTHKQIGELSAVFSEKKDPTDQKAAAEKIIEGAARPATPAQMIGGMADNVGADLKAAGIDDVNVHALSFGTVEKLADVFASGDQSRHRADAMAILDAAPRTGRMTSVADFPAKAEMERIVVDDMKSIGIEVAHPDQLTTGQLSAISKVFQEKRDEGARAGEVKKILNM